MELSDYKLETLRRDEEFILYRGVRQTKTETGPRSILILSPAKENPAPATIERIEHEFSFKEDLDSGWAVRPLVLRHEHSRTTMLLLEDPGGDPLEQLLGAPMELEKFLRIAADITAALGRLHQHGFVHKDLKPANILVNCVDGQARLTGYGIASRLPRERHSPEPPETIAGTLAYIAPEQTGRMNRSIDSRSDLYSLGVTFYQMLTGSLPFTASDPMEWVHCHIARKPVPPGERLWNVPAPVSQIIMKLLAKAAEERYQTAAGVGHDLRRCLAEWKARGRIDEFPLGESDTPDRLFIPERLYGRQREIKILFDTFERVIKSGGPELVLVAGYSGVGKSAVVNELHKVLIPYRGLYGSGKFDQYKRDIPYSTLVQAFQDLVRPLLGKSNAELKIWCAAFLKALGPHGRLMTDLIPELSFIIGDQPPIPELEPRQAQSRFQLVFSQFIGVFARPEHPLVLFLDDLQWLDTATLDLLEDLLNRSDMQHLMLIGAFRENEVDAAHPLTRKLDAIRQAGARVLEIHLASLTRDDVGQLIAHALRCDSSIVAPLVGLVHEKTAGNPFFLGQFLHAIAEAGLLRFDHEAARWSWDLDRIRAKGYTENVVDLMIGRLTCLPAETQNALRQLACLGNRAEITMLSNVMRTPEAQMHAALWPAVCQELVERLEGAYKFTHDRVQEAAYSSIPDASRAEVHLRIGRLLAKQTPPGEQEETIFETVNQFNRGATLITQPEEWDQLAELNLLAGKRAKSSIAYASALAYLINGRELLKDDCWERRHELIFALELNRAECEFLTGQLPVAEERLTALSNRATTTVEQAIVACLRMDVCTTLHQSSRAVAVCLDYLRRAGIEWSPHPKEEEVRREYGRMWSLLRSRAIEDLIDLPLMEDPVSLATVEVLIKVLPPAKQTDENLASLTICKAVSLSLEHGNCDASCVAYVWLARIAGPRFGDYKPGFQFGQLGYDLVEQRGLKRFEASTYHCFAIFVVRWTKHVRTCRDLLRRAFEAANRIGDLTYAAYVCHNLNSDLLFAGASLPEVQAEANNGLAFAEKTRFGLAIDIITTQLALIRTLRGLTPKFGCFDNAQFNEARTEHHLSEGRSLATNACRYWIRKLQARYIAGDYASALDAASKAQLLLCTVSALFEEAEYHFYSGMSHATYSDRAPASERQRHFDAIAAHHQQLKIWAENCPENFENCAALIGAELARLEGRDLTAMSLYEQALRSARDHGFVNHEALASELASRFYAARGFADIAHLYLKKARYCYRCWGAEGKVRQLEEMYPRLVTEESAPGPTTMTATPVEHLDLTTVIKVSQAVAGEMVLEKLINTLMRMAIEQAGAERGLLILTHEGEPRIAAEATTLGDMVRVQLCDARVTASVLPESVLHFVQRTRESVILNDAAAEAPFAADPYIRHSHARSILCVPLINQTKHAGMLYLENKLAPRVFTPTRIAVLKMLASQAAISLENTRLYRDLEEREARIRRLVDANIIGIFIWQLEGRILEANDAFLHMLGYDRGDLVSGRLHWRDLAPPEQFDRAMQQRVAEMKKTDSLQPCEKELFRKDGRRVPVLIGLATFDEAGSQGVAFVLDLTETKRAAEALRLSEHLARGQLEALTGTLAALSKQSEPEKLLEIVLAMIVRQLGACSLGIYEMNENTGRVQLLGNFEDGRLHVVTSNERQTLPQLGRTTPYHPIWTEFFQTGAHCVIGNIQSNTVYVRIAEVPDSPWYDWSSDVVVIPPVQELLERVKADGVVSTLAVPTFIAGKVTGLITIRFKGERTFRSEEIELTRALTHQAMLALQLMRLSQQSREAAVISERNRMARDIHDTLAQGFTGVIMQLEAAKGATVQGNPAEVINRIERASELARLSLGEARRSVRALRPRSLREGKLSVALENLLKCMTDGTELNAEFRAEGDERIISAEYEEDLLRIAQESITNAVRHARARNFKATLSFNPHGITLQLVDDGRGFETQSEHEGFGLIGMKERVDRMGGEFIIRSKPGVGTEILVVVKNQSALKKDKGDDQNEKEHRQGM